MIVISKEFLPLLWITLSSKKNLINLVTLRKLRFVRSFLNVPINWKTNSSDARKSYLHVLLVSYRKRTVINIIVLCCKFCPRKKCQLKEEMTMTQKLNQSIRLYKDTVVIKPVHHEWKIDREIKYLLYCKVTELTTGVLIGRKSMVYCINLHLCRS